MNKIWKTSGNSVNSSLNKHVGEDPINGVAQKYLLHTRTLMSSQALLLGTPPRPRCSLFLEHKRA